MEIEHSHQIRNTPQKLLYPHHAISLNNYQQILQLFFKDLIFKDAIDQNRQLDLQEVQKLKIICDQIYSKYQDGKLSLGEIQGIWSLITFVVPNINGLQIYLYFEYLIAPNQVKQLNLQIKQQQREFDPQGYFQNNKWIYRNKFVQSLRVLQRRVINSNQEDNIKQCLKILQFITADNYQYIIAGKDLRDSYEHFKNKLIKEYQSKRIIEQSSTTPYFTDLLFQQGFMLSQPDFMHNILANFTKQEYKQNHTTNTMILLSKPIKKQNQQENSQDGSSYQQTITIKQKKTSLGTKRRIPKEKSSIRDTPVRRYTKPLPRTKIVEKWFQLDNKKNKVLEEIKKTRKRQEKQKKRKKRLEKIQKEVKYFSDDEQEKKENRKKKEKRQKNNNKRISAQSQPESRKAFSNRNSRQQVFIDDSEQQQIVMKKRRLHKKPIYDFDYEESSQQDQDNIFYPKKHKSKMFIEEEEQIIYHKVDQYCIGKIKINQEENDHRIMEKLENLQVTKLQLNEGGYGMMNEFDFAKYRQKLKHLQIKQIKKQVHKIIKQAILRQQVPFDIDLTLKIVATWTILRCSKQLQKDQMDIYITPLLKYIIGANFYRCVCEIFNNSFDWTNNQHQNQLKRAFAYFSTLFQVGRNFVSLGLQNQLMDIFYQLVITPNKYQKLIKNQTFFSQSQCINLKNPFKLARKNLKFKLQQNQQKIAFFVSSLIMQVLFLWRFVDKNCEAFKKRQSQFSKNIKKQLSQLSSKYSSQWFYKLTSTVKAFYLSYKPYLTKQYFLLMGSILNCSLQKLILESITNQDDYQSNNQISFLIQLITDYFQARWNQPLKLNPLAILNQLILQTKFKEIYGNQKNNATSNMIYSSILRSLIANPIFKTEQAVQSVFLKYLKEYILPDLSNIISSLKNNIYQPVFELIKQVYQFKVNKKLIELHGNDDNIYHVQITDIINNLWQSLDRKHDDLQRLLIQRQKPKNYQNFLEKSDCQKQTRKIKQKLQKCQKGLHLFLKFFIVQDDNSSANSLPLSASHYFYRLIFSIKYNYFIKYLNNFTTELTQCILQNIFFLVRNPRYNQKKYTNIIVDHFNTAIKHKQTQYNSTLRQHHNPVIQEAIALIIANNLISAAEQSKNQLVSPPDNNIIKFIKENIQGINISFHNIEKSIYCLNFFLGKLVTYVDQRQNRLNEVIRIKKYFWQYFIGKWMKQIVMLVFLGGVLQNNIENQNIPLKQMVDRLRKLLSMSQNYNNMKALKDFGYTVFLFNLQRTREYNSLTDILSTILNFRKSSSTNSLLDKGIQSLFLDVFNSFKKIHRFQRQKQPVTIQCIRILTFLLEFPELLVESIKIFLKEMQVISNAISLITQIRINQVNLSILLKLFQNIELRDTKIHKVHQTMQIYISKVTEIPQTQAARQNYFKKIKRILASVRECLKKDIKLRNISLIFIRKFLKSFCSPQKLNLQNKQTGVFILQIYLQMMKSSVLERSAYEELIVKNHKRYQMLILRLMSKLQNQEYSTLQSTVITCMIGRYSDFDDIERLIGSIKNDSLLSSIKKKSIINLLQKLRITAAEVGNNQKIVEKCCNQIASLQKEDNLQDWMDIQ